MCRTYTETIVDVVVLLCCCVVVAVFAAGDVADHFFDALVLCGSCELN